MVGQDCGVELAAMDQALEVSASPPPERCIRYEKSAKGYIGRGLSCPPASAISSSVSTQYKYFVQYSMLSVSCIESLISLASGGLPSLVVYFSRTLRHRVI